MVKKNASFPLPQHPPNPRPTYKKTTSISFGKYMPLYLRHFYPPPLLHPRDRSSYRLSLASTFSPLLLVAPQPSVLLLFPLKALMPLAFPSPWPLRDFSIDPRWGNFPPSETPLPRPPFFLIPGVDPTLPFFCYLFKEENVPSV